MIIIIKLDLESYFNPATKLLYLSGKGITDDYIPEIINYIIKHPEVKILSLSRNTMISNDGTIALASIQRSLSLSIYDTSIGFTGKQALVQNPNLNCELVEWQPIPSYMKDILSDKQSNRNLNNSYVNEVITVCTGARQNTNVFNLLPKDILMIILVELLGCEIQLPLSQKLEMCTLVLNNLLAHKWQVTNSNNKRIFKTSLTYFSQPKGQTLYGCISSDEKSMSNKMRSN